MLVSPICYHNPVVYTCIYIIYIHIDTHIYMYVYIYIYVYNYIVVIQSMVVAGGLVNLCFMAALLVKADQVT